MTTIQATENTTETIKQGRVSSNSPPNKTCRTAQPVNGDLEQHTACSCMLQNFNRLKNTKTECQTLCYFKSNYSSLVSCMCVIIYVALYITMHTLYV